MMAAEKDELLMQALVEETQPTQIASLLRDVRNRCVGHLPRYRHY